MLVAGSDVRRGAKLAGPDVRHGVQCGGARHRSKSRYSAATFKTVSSAVNAGPILCVLTPALMGADASAGVMRP